MPNLVRLLPVSLLSARLVSALLAFTVHELAHGLAATALGDPTPRRSNRLTLNPFAHVEWIGLLGGVLVGVGWSRRMPFQPYAARLPARLAALIVLAAGPLANLALAAGGLALLNTLGLPLTQPWGWPGSPVLLIADVLSALIRFNVMLALLNLLPLFPLDGYQVVRALLPGAAVSRWERAAGWTTTVLGVGLAMLLMLPAVWIERVINWLAVILLGWFP